MAVVVVVAGDGRRKCHDNDETEVVTIPADESLIESANTRISTILIVQVLCRLLKSMNK